MKKVIILLLGISLTAASCDLGGLLDLGSGGVRGVLKSEDSGETFRPAEKLANKGDINNITANALVFEPGNPDTIFMASSGGIYKSSDGAKTWHYILSGISVSDVGVDPYQPNIIYAAGIVGSNGKIIKSLDKGTSWVDIYTEPSKSNAVLSIAVSPGNSSVVLAGLATGEIIRSVDGGHTWQSSKDFADRIIRIKFGPSGSAYALTVHKGVERSLDQGTTWDSISGDLSNFTFNSSIQASSSVTVFYDMALDRRQAGTIYLGTEQGLFRTVDDGNSWAFLSFPVKNASLRVSAVAINPNNSNDLFAAVSATFFKSSNGGVTWETKVLPTNAGIRSILVNSQVNNLIYLGMGAGQ